MSYRYAIQVEVSDPLSGDQMEELARVADEFMGNLGNYLGPLGYEGYQDGVSVVVPNPDGGESTR